MRSHAWLTIHSVKNAVDGEVDGWDLLYNQYIARKSIVHVPI